MAAPYREQFVALCCAAVMGFTFRAIGQCDAGWLVPATGAPGSVSAQAEYMGVLAAAGQLTAGASTDSVALWDGVGWHTLGATNGNVHALLELNNDLVVAGDFTTIEGVSAFNIARWDGANWEALGSGTSAKVYSMVVYDRALIAGGRFAFAGGVSVEGLARWDGVAWNSMGLDYYGAVYCLTVQNDRLLAGTGGRIFVGGYVVEWNGTEWRVIGGQFFDGDHLDFGYVIAITSFNNQLVAGGYFYHLETPYGPSADCLARWNGSTWEAFPEPVWEWDLVWQLKVYSGSLVAGGEGIRNIARWDGTSWSGLGTGMNDAVYALAVHQGELVAGGAFTLADGMPSSHFARWTDTGIPWIAVQPVSPGQVCAGAEVGMSITPASGYEPVTYRWRRDGTDLADGATGTGSVVSGSGTGSLSLVNVRGGDRGSYDCVVSNACGNGVSGPALLGVCAADFDCDRFVTGLDFDLFAVAFEAGEQSTDFDQDGFVTGIDYDEFVYAFEAGC